MHFKKRVLKRIPRRGRYLMHYARMRRCHGVQTYPLGWLVWFAAALFVLFQFTLQLSAGEIVTGLMKSFNLTTFGVGILISAYYYIYTALQTPVGMLVDRFGPRVLLSLGMIFCSLGCLVFGFSHWVFIAVIGRLMMGAGAAFAFVGCVTLAGRWFPVRRFAVMVGLLEAIGMMGTMVIGYWIAHMLTHYTWRHFMVISAVVGIVLGVIIGLVVRNAPPSKRLAPVSLPPKGRIFRDLRQLLSDHRVWCNALYCGLMFSVVTVFCALWGVPFFETAYHLSLATASLTAYLTFAGIALGSPVLGFIDARLPWRRVMMMGTPILVAALLLAVIYFPLPIHWLMVAMFLIGLTCSTYALTFTVGSEVATPFTKGTSLGFVNTACVGFAPILQAYIGYLLLHFSSGHGQPGHYNVPAFHHALIVLPLMVFFSSILAYFIPARLEE